MESTKLVIAYFHPGDLLASVDIKDASCISTPFTALQSYLHFGVGMQNYRFSALPFSLSTAPWNFTKVLAPVLARLHSQNIPKLVYRYSRLLSASMSYRQTGPYGEFGIPLTLINHWLTVLLLGVHGPGFGYGTAQGFPSP